MGCAKETKAESLIQNNCGTTSFIPPMNYPRCQIFSMKFLLISLFLFLIWLMIPVLLVLITGFFPVNYYVLIIHISDHISEGK